VVDVLVVQYRKQPRPQVRSLLPQMQFAESTSQAVLNEIVCLDQIARQRTRVASKAGNLGFNFPIGVGHRRLLPMTAIGRWADPNISKSIGSMLSNDVSARGFV